MLIYIIFSFILLYFLCSLSNEDLKTMLISEIKLRMFAASGILYLLFLGINNEEVSSIDLIINNLFSALIIFLIMYSIKYLSYQLIQINSLGLGDIKLCSYSSIWLGVEYSFISICISFILSAIYTLHGKATKRFKTFHQYPFAPFLSIGIFFSWLLDKI